MALSGAFGIREVIPRLPGFAEQHPKLGIELLVSDRTEDLIAEGADMALRLGPLTDFGSARDCWARLRASPLPRLPTLRAGERRKPPPTSPRMTAFSDRVSPADPAQSSPALRAGRLATVGGPIKVASADGVVACAKAGLGIALASRWMCRAELQAGELVAILPNYQLDWVELHAVYPGGRRPALKVRAFSDYFAAQLMQKSEGG